MVAIGSFVFLVLGFTRSFRVNPFLHGSARWADERDIKAAGLLNNDGVYVGAWRDKRGTVRYLRHNGPEHVLCYAPTRSGKGVGLVVPTLLSWTQSAVITDLKGELYELTAGWRQEHAHNKVLRFEPAASSGSCCFKSSCRIAHQYRTRGWRRPKPGTPYGRSARTRAEPARSLAKNRLLLASRLHLTSLL